MGMQGVSHMRVGARAMIRADEEVMCHRQGDDWLGCDQDGVHDHDTESDAAGEEVWSAAPYGPENTKPIFVTKNVIDANGCRLVGIDQKHLKLDIYSPDNRNARCSGIAFNVENPQKCIEHIKSKKPFNICYTLEENNFNGKKSIQLMVKDIQLTWRHTYRN